MVNVGPYNIYKYQYYFVFIGYYPSSKSYLTDKQPVDRVMVVWARAEKC